MIKPEIVRFFEFVKKEKIELYNEFSFQHELGIFLRNNLPDYKIQFERNVDTLFSEEIIEKTIKEGMVKKEIDISIHDSNTNEKYVAIELKFPRQKQYPEQMYSFIKDIKFAEQLKRLGFRNTCCVVLVDDPLFYSDGRAENGIYKYFRKAFKVPGRTCIEKPTGKDKDCIKLDRDYSVEWEDIEGEKKFYCIEIEDAKAL